VSFTSCCLIFYLLVFLSRLYTSSIFESKNKHLMKLCKNLAGVKAACLTVFEEANLAQHMKKLM